MQGQIRPSLFTQSLICIVCCVSIATLACKASATESPIDSTSCSIRFSEQRFEDEVKEYLGTPYRKGGISKKGMDCSGFARMVYDRLLGLDLPHSSGDQFHSSELQKIDRHELQTGDLVFFANKKKKRINHVGVYLSDGQFIHASSSEGIIVSSLNDKYWKKRFVGSKRHIALSSVENGSDYRLTNYLELPINESGTLSYFSREEFSASSPLADDLERINYDFPALAGTPSAPRNFHEISYNQKLFDNFDISLSAFTERFDTNNGWPETGSATLTTNATLLDTSLDTSLRQGLTLSTDYHPSNWLSFTPSFTYFDNSVTEEQLTSLPRRTLGLNTQLAPEDSNWSVSMLVQYTDGAKPASYASMDNKISSLDLAIKLGISLTENLQFSIMSNKHDKRTSAFSLGDDSALNRDASSDVALVFDFSY